MTMQQQSLFDSIVQFNRAYLNNLPCTCEQNTEDMRASWVCPRHGYREPDYEAIDRRERAIMKAEARSEGDR